MLRLTRRKVTAMSGYSGLPRGTVTFLSGLAANNRKDWFEAHRSDYESDWRGAGLDLVSALAPFCAAASPGLEVVPKVGGSLRRINRDVRFSADKSPYQAMLHIALWRRGGPEHGGMHLAIGPTTLGFGAGEWGLAHDRLARFRERVGKADGRARLLKAAAHAEAAGSRWDEPDLKRVPPGFSADPDWDHLLRRKSVILRGEMPHPDWLFTPDSAAHLGPLIAAHLPLLAWLAGLD
ncbi:MAG: TIGR02453 family protein [Paracoccaceae bacterium]